MLKSSIELPEKLIYTWWKLLICLLGLFIIYIYIFFFEKRPIKQNLQNTAKYVDEHENDKNMFIFKNLYINQQYIMT